MLGDKKISVVIPCLNEESGLAYLFETMPNFIDEVIIADNTSTDKSTEIAKKYNAKVLTEKVKGYGIVLLKGLKHATGDTIIIMDGDGTYTAERLKELCTFLEDNDYDFISGCRFPLTDFMAMPFINRVSNYFISWLIRKVFKVNIQDSQSGLMLFKKGILNKISIYNKGMGFSQEIKIKAWLSNKIKCGEMHIPYNIRIGKVKFRKIKDGLKNLYDLYQLAKDLKTN